MSNAQPPQHSPRVQRRRDGQDTTSKAPQSPTAASVAETLDSPVAATDENASVVDDGGGNLRRSNRGAFKAPAPFTAINVAIAHKRRASEMDVELPPPSLKISEHSATVEEERMSSSRLPCSLSHKFLPLLSYDTRHCLKWKWQGHQPENATSNVSDGCTSHG